MGFLAMFTGLAAGITIYANLKELFGGGTAALGVAAVFGVRRLAKGSGPMGGYPRTLQQS
jgi:hypothetical protein